ncbi:MAG: hypothetical protein KJ726_04230, partial [Verrucomicrobia bacterium]|nr:hypothetical protein [Verrucomicrobiota bacterium]
SRVPFDTDGINEIVAEIRSALSRFPDGIRTIVTVPDFISRDLGFDHSHLQADLADLLREILLQKQGLAVVEINEARSIAVELERTGGDLRRLVPLLVEGEYRTDPRGQEGPSISIKVTLRKGEQEAVRIESGAIPIDAAGAFIVGTVQPEALNLLSESGGPGDAPGASFTRLIARADQFAEIGDFERAAALREAALLLQPQAVDQRVALVREYARWNHDPVEVWPRAASKGWDGPFWEYVVGQCRASWRRSLQHVERLILNRQVDLKVGGELFEDTIHSICGIRPTNAAQLGEEERLKKDFIRHVAPALFQLPSSDSPSMREQQRELAVYRIFEMAFLRADGNFLHEEDLDLVGDLLCELLPEDTPVPMVLLYRLKDGTRMFGGDPERNVSPEAWARFARRLMNSPRPLAKACGQYAWLCDHHYRLNQVSEALLAEAESLSASLDSAPLETLDISRHLKQVANEELGWARGAWQKTMATSALSRQEAAPPPNPTPSVEGPLVQAEGTILCERVRLDPLEILLVSQGPGSEKLEGHRWRAAGGSYGWLEIIPAWEGLDVVFSTGAILFLGADQTAREILVGEELSIGSVVFDGRHVWASGGYDQGVYVIDRDGHLVAHITAADGLPDSSYCTPLHVIGPGRVLAAGSIGIKGRGWLATLELVGTRPRVNVFHEAVKAWPHGDASAEAALDPTMRFFPEWIMGHR